MAKWARPVVIQSVFLLTLVLAVTSACSNMFSQADGEVTDIVFEFHASLLFSEQGAAADGAPYLIPTADRIEARLIRDDGSDAVSPVIQPLERVAENEHVIATILEFPSVPTNVAYTVNLRVFSSAEPAKTLHAGSAIIEPITRTTRDERVQLRVDPGVVEPDVIEVFTPKTVSPELGDFALYLLDTDLRPAEPHILVVEGTPDLVGVRVQVLSSSFRGTSIAFSDTGTSLEASLPASAEPYFLAVYRETDAPAGALDVEFSLSSFAPPGVTGVVSPTNINTPSFTVTGPPDATFKYTVTGATTFPEVDVPDLGSTGEETIILPTLNEGTHTITVYYEDVFGNISGETIFEIVTDYTPPPPPTGVGSVNLQGLPPDQITYTDMPIFTWFGSGEPGATWEYTIDGGTTWLPSAVTSVTLGPLAPGVYDFLVREIDEAGNESGPPPLLQFEYIELGGSVITITNPGVPVFSMSPAGFTINVTTNDSQEIVVVSGETIDNYVWMINGFEVSSGAAQNVFDVDAVWANDAGNPTLLGSNTLTLVVEIGGLPYSDDFFFTVVEE